MVKNMADRMNKGSLIGLADVTGRPMREGDVIHYRSFRGVILYNEFEKGFSILHVGAIRDMDRFPSLRADYLEGTGTIGPEIISFWGVRVVDNIDINPTQLNNTSLLAC